MPQVHQLSTKYLLFGTAQLSQLVYGKRAKGRGSAGEPSKQLWIPVLSLWIPVSCAVPLSAESKTEHLAPHTHRAPTARSSPSSASRAFASFGFSAHTHARTHAHHELPPHHPNLSTLAPALAPWLQLLRCLEWCEECGLAAKLPGTLARHQWLALASHSLHYIRCRFARPAT